MDRAKGAGHPDTLEAAFGLGQELMMAGDLDDAAHWLQYARDGLIAAGRHRERPMAVCLYTLGNVQGRRREFEAARATLKQSARLFETLPGADHAETRAARRSVRRARAALAKR